jgi:TorA maturation chaperone TorD
MKDKLILIAMAGAMVFSWSGGMARAQYYERGYEDARRSGNTHHGDFRSDSQFRGSESRLNSRREFGSSDPDAIVRRAYEDVLNREPDKDGLRTYRSRIIDDRWSEQDVRSDLRKSAERAGRTPAAADVIIRRAYQDVLGRDPDSAGLATYRAKLLNENWSERDVRSALKSSSERRETGGISNEQAQEMVRRAYQSVLGREPDSSGSSLYVQKIRQNRWSEADVAKELRNSPEYRNKRRK